MLPRVIPLLLIDGRRLLKTRRFAWPRYVGDPLNTVRILNDREADELIVLDIGATAERGPSFEIIAELVAEACMPVCYGGGVRTLVQMERLYRIGLEKVSLGTAAARLPGLVGDAARRFGGQSVVACVDVSRTPSGAGTVTIDRGRTVLGPTPPDFARACEDAGAGEILLQSVDRDGTRTGYDLDLIANVAAAVSVPVVACGGAGERDDLGRAVTAGASAVAAGSLFVFHGRQQAVLVSYPRRRERELLLRGIPEPVWLPEGAPDDVLP